MVPIRLSCKDCYLQTYFTLDPICSSSLWWYKVHHFNNKWWAFFLPFDGWLGPKVCLSLGLSHTNYNIQIIVVFLKRITIFFLTRALDYWNNYYDCFWVTQIGHTTQNERDSHVFHFGGANSVVNNGDIGLLEHLLWSFWGHTFSAQFITSNWPFSLLLFFLLQDYNKFPKICRHMPKRVL